MLPGELMLFKVVQVHIARVIMLSKRLRMELLWFGRYTNTYYYNITNNLATFNVCHCRILWYVQLMYMLAANTYTNIIFALYFAVYFALDLPVTGQ